MAFRNFAKLLTFVAMIAMSSSLFAQTQLTEEMRQLVAEQVQAQLAQNAAAQPVSFAPPVARVARVTLPAGSWQEGPPLPPAQPQSPVPQVESAE